MVRVGELARVPDARISLRTYESASASAYFGLEHKLGFPPPA